MQRALAILERLEPKIIELSASSAKQSDITTLRAEVRGKLSMLPTWWMLIIGLIATWGAGAAIVRLMMR
jgi:hypothetical protein